MFIYTRQRQINGSTARLVSNLMPPHSALLIFFYKCSDWLSDHLQVNLAEKQLLTRKQLRTLVTQVDILSDLNFQF